MILINCFSYKSYVLARSITPFLEVFEKTRQKKFLMKERSREVTVCVRVCEMHSSSL